MQSGRSQQRAPGSFSPLPNSFSSSAAVAAAAASGRDREQDPKREGRPPSAGRPPSSSSASQQRNPPTPASSSSRPQIRRIDTSPNDEAAATSSNYFNLPPKVRSPQTPDVTSPSFPGFTAHPNGSASSLQSPQNFSRPNRDGLPSVRNASPLTLPTGRIGYHSRKHSQTQGLFDSTLPSTSSSNLAQITTMSHGNIPPAPASAGLSASQIAAQAAMQHQGLQAHQTHSRNRSQTVPFQGSADNHEPTKRQVSRSNGPTAISGGPLSPPVLSLTEASVPRDPAFHASHAAADARYHNGLLGNQAATTAANVVFPRSSPQTSPALASDEYRPTAFPPPLTIPEKPLKSEKSKVKLFSRPKKIDTKGEAGVKPLPSPSKIGSALASLQRGNYSTTSLAETQSLYSLNNSSAATIRPLDAPPDKESSDKKEKEKKHHFLSRSKHKLSAKDDYHLPLSSAASNSRPVDPNAPSSLYNFNVPPSPGPNTSSFGKSVSGLDLRHGGRALREKRKEEKQQLGMAHDNESVFTVTNPTASTTSEWAGPSSLGTNISLTQSNLNFFDPVDSSKYGLNSMTLDDAWPYLKAKLLAIFEGEDLRLPIEDFNRVVSMHIQYAVQRRSAHIIVEDVRELLSTGFLSLDYTLRKTPEDRLIPALAEMWVFTFTSVLPYMQAVFLPLDLEFSGSGPLMTADQARDFWNTVLPNAPAEPAYPAATSQVLDIRRLVLLAYRDTLILPRYDKLKMIFSRLSLEHLPSSLASLALASPPPPSDAILSTSLPREIEFQPLQQQQQQQAPRPGTAMSLDPSVASYNSTSSTLLNNSANNNNNNNDNNSNPSRSRAISNVSFGSGSEGTSSLLRPFTPAAIAIGGGRDRNNSGSNASLREQQRDQNVEMGGKQVTDMVGRMLQCLSVLASVQTAGLAPFEANSQSSSAAGAAAANAAAAAAAASASAGGDEGRNMVTELGRLLKLNWLGRGRTGRNRRGIVGGRIKREDSGVTGASSILSARSSHSGLSGLAIQHQQSSSQQQQPQVLREGVGAAG
ncbi:hypothetical protein PG999_001526 [Apiospora kogelbergensis]|uniref:HbrB-like protein n=1 Tax=Apiospora kogelbergensis TaxID=1337665 RepID=A0AAW0R5V0_9PEZI